MENTEKFTNNKQIIAFLTEAALKRIDLDGQEGDEVSKEHAEHALKTLKESKEKAFANKKKAEADKTPKRAPKKVNLPNRNKKTAVKKEPVEDLSNYKEAVHTELKVSQTVKVLLGKSPVSAVVIEIMKDDVQVQLDSGMTVKVKAKHLIV